MYLPFLPPPSHLPSIPPLPFPSSPPSLLPSFLSAQTTEGYLEFYDTGEPNSPTCQLMNSQDHADMTDLEWDPTGRFVTTSISHWSNKVWGKGGEGLLGCLL